ncbi:MAG TPA: hypothetical protein VK911_10010 [Vicinamibacterales bacterium]|nr:hypothetical protein [Vicinamibacterales bacterium]
MFSVKVEPRVERVISEALDGRPAVDPEQVAALLEIPLFSAESALLQAAARHVSERACNGRAEVHAQVAMNVGPCPKDCLFCSFAACHDLFPVAKEIPLDYVIDQAVCFERAGANAVYLMATGSYPFGRFIERAREVRRRLQPDTVLVANVSDFSATQAAQLKDAGFAGIYHAVRLGEGRDTGIPVSRRLRTMALAREAGLAIGTCLEPVGPEHTTAELVEKLLITRDVAPVFAGAARRISVPDTSLARHGMVSEARMAHILAVARLVLPLDVRGNCTHEPSVLGAAVGANLFWAESGANPRDTRERTEEGRGLSVGRCRELLGDASWDCLAGSSAFFSLA